MNPQAVMSPDAVEVCRAFSHTGLVDEFYLAGGTGLALQLCHRRSDDLDFFTIQPTELIGSNSVTEHVEKAFGSRVPRLELRTPSQQTWRIQGVKVFFIAYPFPLLHRLVDLGPNLKLGKVKAASVREIAAMKSYALGRRAVARDYVDLYFILKSGVRLDEIMNDASRKFILAGEPVFSPKLFLEQLAYTEDLEDIGAAVATVTSEGLSIGEVERFLRQEVKRYLPT